MLFTNVFQPDDWRLFIDGCTVSLKVVLLHNKNEKPSIPIAYSKTCKESYETMKLILDLIEYKKHEWLIIGDFKVMFLLMGLASGFAGFPCPLCLFDSRDDAAHYDREVWPPRKKFKIGDNSVKRMPLVSAQQFLPPILHIKMGLTKQLVTVMAKNKSRGIQRLKQLFPLKTEDKVKAGIFTGPEIRVIMEDEDFVTYLNEDEKDAWEALVKVITGFLGGNRVEEYKDLIEHMLSTFEAVGSRMSVKLHYLKSHLKSFKENNAHFSEEQGERFHQDLKPFERRYDGKKSKERMLGEYIWSIVRETNDEDYKRKTRNCLKLKLSEN